jgi:hypothetical protein
MKWLARLLGRRRAGEARPPEGAEPQHSRPATWDDAVTVARLLNAHQVRYALIGGYALAVNGYVRNTGDVDILVDADPQNTSRWIAALSELPDGVARELSPEPNPFRADTGDEDADVIRINDAFTVDVMSRACGLTYNELREHVIEQIVDGVGIHTLDLEGLLRTKQGVRPKDQADRQVLERALAAGRK